MLFLATPILKLGSLNSARIAGKLMGRANGNARVRIAESALLFHNDLSGFRLIGDGLCRHVFVSFDLQK
jgi:hypothetical protein